MEILLLLLFIGILVFRSVDFESRRLRRRDYYRNVYLKSDEWKRKRYVVLRRDNWCCVYCGARATQVHHKRYARKNIGKEPIDWLVSICKPCHEEIHQGINFTHKSSREREYFKPDRNWPTNPNP